MGLILKELEMSKYRNLLLFFLFTFFWTWTLWFAEIKFSVKLFLAPFGPTISGLIFTYIDSGESGLKNLLKSLLNYKFEIKWFLVIFLLMPFLTGVSYLVGLLIDKKAPDLSLYQNISYLVGAFFYILFLGGPLAEEIGWRGFALPRLQKIFGPIKSSVLLGIIWGLWHLPLYFMPNQDIYRNIPFLWFLFGATMLSFLFTWIYNKTNRNVLAVILFHTTSNYAQFIFPSVQTTFGGLISLILNIILVIYIISDFKTKKK